MYGLGKAKYFPCTQKYWLKSNLQGRAPRRQAGRRLFPQQPETCYLVISMASTNEVILLTLSYLLAEMRSCVLVCDGWTVVAWVAETPTW
jgi:hypothetical protein